MAILRLMETLTAPEHLPITGAIVAAIVAAIAVPMLYRLVSDPFAEFPQFGNGSVSKLRDDFNSNSIQSFADGYRAFTDRAFRIWTSSGMTHLALLVGLLDVLPHASC